MRGGRITAVLMAAAACAAASTWPAAAAGDPATRQKAQPCALCHGAQGISVAPDAPNLAGQPEMYLNAQLKAFRSGKRQHEVMTLMAKNLSDDDIRDLSAWFASFAVELKPEAKTGP